TVLQVDDLRRRLQLAPVADLVAEVLLVLDHHIGGIRIVAVVLHAGGRTVGPDDPRGPHAVELGGVHASRGRHRRGGEVVGHSVHGQVAHHVGAVVRRLEGVVELAGDIDAAVGLVAEEPRLVVDTVAGIGGDLGAVDGDADGHRLALGGGHVGDVLGRLRE